MHDTWAARSQKFDISTDPTVQRYAVKNVCVATQKALTGPLLGYAKAKEFKFYGIAVRSKLVEYIERFSAEESNVSVGQLRSDLT